MDREGVTEPVVDADANVDATEPVADSHRSPDGSSPRVALPPSGYRLGSTIGSGGMGEVVVAFDQRIGREVAIKRMRGAHPSDEATARFLREARIQARLDHPAIVPVHELGIDDAGRPYFTMKRLAGRTLGQRIAEGGPENRLLRAFVDVCLAVEFAHARGVVHRDLKPSNIMLGDYGEVYVIDWGVARVLADPQQAEPRAPRAATAPDGAAPGTIESIESIQSIDEGTATGAVLGTPGYCAPEQLKGDAVSTPADIYALGSILFELLTGETLHPKVHQKAIASTLTAAQEQPSRRRPDRAIPPELDAVCFDALAEDPGQRPTAHRLAHAVQAYLDGDRDVERRRTLAVQQLRTAREALGARDATGRTTALRAAGRALALDPESTDAAELVGTLLLEPPSASSPELAESLAAHERQLARGRSRTAIFAYLSPFAFLPAALFLFEVANWTMLVAFYATLLVGVASSWVHTRTGRPSVPITLAVTFALAMLFTRFASPFVLTPILICCAIVAVTSIPAISERPWLLLGWTAAAVVTPFALEWFGVLSQTWEMTGSAIAIRGDIFYTGGLSEELALIGSYTLFTGVVAWIAVTISRQRLAAQRQLYVQAWHLRQLLPTPAEPTGHRPP